MNMANETRITVVGNLTADPEMSFTPNNSVPVANFTVASTQRVYNKETNNWQDKSTIYIRCSAWRDMAENVVNTLKKGMPVIVTGDLTSRQYETKEGNKGISWELEHIDVGPSLRRSSFTQNQDQNQGGGGYQNNNGGYQNQGNQGGGYNKPQGNNGGWNGPSQGNNNSEPPF